MPKELHVIFSSDYFGTFNIFHDLLILDETMHYHLLFTNKIQSVQIILSPTGWNTFPHVNIVYEFLEANAAQPQLFNNTAAVCKHPSRLL